jgi:hypothetical protein
MIAIDLNDNGWEENLNNKIRSMTSADNKSEQI